MTSTYTKRPVPLATGILLVKISEVKKVTSKNGKPGVDFSVVVANAPDERLVGTKVTFLTFYLPEDPDDDSRGAIFQVNRLINFIGAVTNQDIEDNTGIDIDNPDLFRALLEELVTVRLENQPFGDPPRDSLKILEFWPASQYDVLASKQREAERSRF